MGVYGPRRGGSFRKAISPTYVTIYEWLDTLPAKLHPNADKVPSKDVRRELAKDPSVRALLESLIKLDKIRRDAYCLSPFRKRYHAVTKIDQRQELKCVFEQTSGLPPDALKRELASLERKPVDPKRMSKVGRERHERRMRHYKDHHKIYVNGYSRPFRGRRVIDIADDWWYRKAIHFVSNESSMG